MSTIVTVSGRSRELPPNLAAKRVVGLDEEGRVVVDDFGALAEPVPAEADYAFRSAPFVFGLTLCCDASDKGVEDGVVCRGCYGYDEVGNYLYRAPDGTFPGLDPIKEITQ